MLGFDFMPVLCFLPIVFAIFVDILWAAAISYGAALVAQQFGKKPKQRLPDLGGYPIQTSQKGIAIPKVYGCERVAGNVIWMGEQQHYEKKTHQPGVDGHVRVKTYKKDFLIGIAEGSGHITKIWDGKTLVWESGQTSPKDINVTIFGFNFTFEVGTGYKNNDTQTIYVGPATTVVESPSSGSIRISKGDGTQDARFYTGEVFGKYDDLIWAYFEDFETGPTPNIPNFSFEICEQSGYRYTYISENGSIWGIPLFGTDIQSLDEDGVAVNVGGGVVGLPMANTPFKAGEVVLITNTTNYNGSFVLGTGTTDNQLQITDTYVAETFDGTEIVVKHIASLPSGAGRMDQDAAGNLYYGHAKTGSSPNIYFVTKIAPDGTQTTNILDAVWSSATANIQGLKVDADYLYLWREIDGVTDDGQLSKWRLSDGTLVWANTATWPGNDIDIDADGNVYAARNATIGHTSRFASADGAYTQLANSLGVYAIHVDDSMSVVISAGWQVGGGDKHNLFVTSLDEVNNDSIALGGYNGADTWIIGTGMLTTLNGVIYVLSYTPSATLYKITWDGSSMTIVDSVAVQANAQGIYADLSGNIVVVSQTWVGGETEIMSFYDSDLNSLGSIDGFYSFMLHSWASSVGGSWIQGNAVFYPGIGAGDKDANPAAMIDDLARNDRYGAGIAQAYINDAAVLEEFGYWAQQNNEISLALTEQLPFMDWVDNILSHCNGFRNWSEGKFNIGAFKDEASIVSLTQDDLVREEGDNPSPPVQIVKRKASETTNLIEVSWVDRSNTYDASVAMAKDDVDQRVSGKVRINPIDLRGIHNATLAQKQAYRLLFEGMYRFTIYSFDVSYKNMLYTVGDVITLSDGGLVTDQRVRIIAREEDKDGRSIHIEAVEDISELYPSIAYTTQQTLAVPDTPVGSDDLVTGTLSFREHVTLPQLYMFFAPGDSDTDGALVYRSYDNITWLFIGRLAFDKDSLPNSAGTTTSALPRAKAVMHRYSESFTVDIGTITSLRTDVSDDDFFNNQSLAKIGDEIIAFKTTEDQGSGIWKVTQLIRGLFGTEAVEHASGAVFATVSLIDILYELNEEVAGQTVYFKALATSGEVVSQQLSDVTATEYTIVNEHERPYPLSIQRIKDYGGFDIVSSFPVTLAFNLASKEAGYNLGGFGEIGWGNFTKDDRIVGINVTLKTLDGTQISFEYHSLDGYHAENYELTIAGVDRNGNDPIIVEMEPVTSLPSSKATANMIDLVS